MTETFVALRLNIDNWRWADVPIYMRVGKRLPKSGTEISIHFKKAPLVLFNKESRTLDQNVLVIRIQPDEGNFVADAGENAGHEFPHRTGENGFSLRDLVRQSQPGGIRTLASRRHERGRHALRAAR